MDLVPRLLTIAPLRYARAHLRCGLVVAYVPLRSTYYGPDVLTELIGPNASLRSLLFLPCASLRFAYYFWVKSQMKWLEMKNYQKSENEHLLLCKPYCKHWKRRLAPFSPAFSHQIQRNPKETAPKHQTRAGKMEVYNSRSVVQSFTSFTPSLLRSFLRILTSFLLLFFYLLLLCLRPFRAFSRRR